MNGVEDLDVLVRAAAFDALREWQGMYGEVLDVDVLRRGIEVAGQQVAIFNLMRGIHSPRQLDSALAATTAPPKIGKEAPYEDYLGDDGLFRYHYFGDDPQASDNRMLRACLTRGLPIIYYYGVVPGRYLPYFPVQVVDEDVLNRYWLLDLTGMAATDLDVASDSAERRYATSTARARLHQARFREKVLRAYRVSCAVCRLRHAELLDASHIIGDRQGGQPVVTNGLALCKLHHAAFDRHVLGVRPDLIVQINQAVLDEIDGPMLKHGLQEFHGQSLMIVPRRRTDRPDALLLEQRWEAFRAAG